MSPATLIHTSGFFGLPVLLSMRPLQRQNVSCRIQPHAHSSALFVCWFQVADCQVKLQRADKLIGGLCGERSRWSATVQQLQSDLHNVVGDVVLAAGE